MKNKRFGSLTSSVNENELSLTFQSIAKVLIGIVGWYAAQKGLDPNAATNQFQQIVDLGVMTVPALFAAFHSLQALWGLIRKFIVFITNPANDPLH